MARRAKQVFNLFCIGNSPPLPTWHHGTALSADEEAQQSEMVTGMGDMEYQLL